VLSAGLGIDTADKDETVEVWPERKYEADEWNVG
jgi:hypothetical protein